MKLDQRLAGWLYAVRRSTDEGIVGGVCAGLGRALGMDATLVRLAVLVLALASGLGVLAYLLLWLLLPAEETEGESVFALLSSNVRHLGEELGRVGERGAAIWARSEDDDSGWPRPLTRRWLAISAVVGGALLLLHSLGLFSWLGPLRVVGLLLMICGAAALMGYRPRWRE